MTERFLRYSLTHNRPVRVMYSDTMKFQNITVVFMEGDHFGYLSAKNKKVPLVRNISDVLSAGYARGDSGDTLENSLREETAPVADDKHE